jgi:hypothetical protein
VIGAPPSPPGLVNATVTARNPVAFTEVIVGAPGGVGRTVTREECADARPSPIRFRAATVQV